MGREGFLEEVVTSDSFLTDGEVDLSTQCLASYKPSESVWTCGHLCIEDGGWVGMSNMASKWSEQMMVTFNTLYVTLLFFYLCVCMCPCSYVYMLQCVWRGQRTTSGVTSCLPPRDGVSCSFPVWQAS